MMRFQVLLFTAILTVFQFNFVTDFSYENLFEQSLRRVRSPQDFIFKIFPLSEFEPNNNLIGVLREINSQIGGREGIDPSFKEMLREMLREIEWLKESDSLVLKKLFFSLEFMSEINKLKQEAEARESLDRLNANIESLFEVFNYYTFMERLKAGRLVEERKYPFGFLRGNFILLFGWENIIAVSTSVLKGFSLSISADLVTLWIKSGGKEQSISFPKELFIEMPSYKRVKDSIEFDKVKIKIELSNIEEEPYGLYGVFRKGIPVRYLLLGERTERDKLGLKIREVNRLFDEIGINEEVFLLLREVHFGTDSDKTDGSCWKGSSAISLAQDRAPYEMARTIIHEVMHLWYALYPFKLVENIKVARASLPASVSNWFNQRWGNEIPLDSILDEACAYLAGLDITTKLIEHGSIDFKDSDWYSEVIMIGSALEFLNARKADFTERGREILHRLSVGFASIQERAKRLLGDGS